MKSIVKFFTKHSTQSTAVILLSLFCLVSIGLLMPTHIASANVIGDAFYDAIVGFFASRLTALLVAIVTTILVIISTILTVFAIIMGAVMDAIINFSLAVPYTPANPAAANTVITIAWGVMRDLANIGLVFVLIAIAVSTILELGTERWRKLLIPFIGIALLINFTPVITGFIIDVTNILTKIFFDAGGAGGGWKLFLPAFSTLGSIWLTALKTIFTGDVGVAFGVFAQALVDVIFHILSIAAFVAMSLLILIRILAVWILVIISPLAFVAYILPETRKYFSQWWGNFFQWAILPIPLGLFYWLAARFIASGNALCTNFSFTNPSGITGSYNTITAYDATTGTGLTILQNANMCNAIMLLFAIGTLFVGFMISFSFSAVGSKLIVSNGTKWGTAAGTWMGKKTGRATVGVGRTGYRAAKTRIAGTPVGQKIGGAYAGAKTKASTVAGKVGSVLGQVPGATTAGKYVKSQAKAGYTAGKKKAGEAVKGSVPFAQKQLAGLGPAGAAMGAGLARGMAPKKVNKIPTPGRFDPDKISPDEIKNNVADWVWGIQATHLRNIHDNYNPDVMDAVVDQLIKIYNDPAALLKFNNENKKFAQFTATFQAQQIDPRIPNMYIPTPGSGGTTAGEGTPGATPGAGGASQPGTIVPPWQQPPSGPTPAPTPPPTPPSSPKPTAATPVQTPPSVQTPPPLPTATTGESMSQEDLDRIMEQHNITRTPEGDFVSKPTPAPTPPTSESGKNANFVTKAEAAKKEAEQAQKEQYKAELEEQQNRLRAQVEQTEATYNLNETPENLERYRKAVNDAIQDEPSPARRAAYIKILQQIYNKRGT
ncbi:MAG: hypothetical protein HYV65_01790 [Candidatus Spechtbacteria bacterium]|nr:hypothetical protein [Candidatus Spechtbacteria bacterium]